MILPEEQLKTLDNVIKDFRIALKNSALYSPEHPLCNYSISNLKSTLDKWFITKDQLDLGMSQTSLFFNGEPINEKDERYRELANYLHMRGLIALSILKGVNDDELKDFFTLVRMNRKDIRENGGIGKNFPPNRHIKIKEIDYSALLQSAKNTAPSDEAKTWQFLFQTAEESKSGDLPKSKIEFLLDFFKDVKQSAKTLNKVYREATAQLQDETAVDDIRKTIHQICQYLEQHSVEKAKELKIRLMNVISQLHPDLVNILFEHTIGSEDNFDLVEAITKDFSEDYIAEFIESLVSNEDTFNENLLKVFDKLTPGSSKANNVVSQVAEKLFDKKIINPDTLSQLQMSIMEIFKRHPESDFMNQIYKITVDAVMNKKIDTLVYMARLSPLINKFVQSMEGEQMKTEKIWLLLNILWLENNAKEFKKFTEKLVTVMPELLDAKDLARIKDIVEFFTEKVRPEQKNDEGILQEIKEGLSKITNKKTIQILIGIVPEATQKGLEDIIYTLLRSESDSAKQLVDAFMSEKNTVHRNKFWFIFGRMRIEIAKEVVNRLEYCDSATVKDLFQILKECDPRKTQLAAKKLIGHKNAQIRWEALEVLEPKTEDEMGMVFKIYRKEKNASVKKKAASVLLRTENPDEIRRLFKHAGGGLFRRRTIFELVELCGNVQCQSSLVHLERIFNKRALFNTKRKDDLRIAAVTSASRLKTESAKKLVESGLNDKNPRVRETCEIILKLDE